MKGLVAFSFASGAIEPSLCNRRLARAVERILDKEKEEVVVIAQWEIASSTWASLACVVKEHRQKGAYLDSDEVMAQAARVFNERGITKVIPVANPFLHLAKCRTLVRDAGFTPIKQKIGWIGFYRESLQWWTRGPFRLLLYAVLIKLTGRRGR